VEGGGDQSEHEIDMHKKQIHSLRAEHRTLQHMQVSHLANTSLINLVTASCEYLFRSRRRLAHEAFSPFRQCSP